LNLSSLVKPLFARFAHWRHVSSGADSTYLPEA
jgi:hypothetical protein